MNTKFRVEVPVCCLLLLTMVGCGGSPSAPAAGSASVPTSEQDANIQAANFKKEFEQAQRLAAESQLEQQRLKERRRGLIEVAFQKFDEEGRVVVSVTNRTGKPIDDVSGGFMVEDADGNFLASSGLTIAVPGDVFLDVDATLEHAPFMSPRPELTERLQAQPQSVRFAFEASKITYADGTTEPDLDS